MPLSHLDQPLDQLISLYLGLDFVNRYPVEYAPSIAHVSLTKPSRPHGNAKRPGKDVQGLLAIECSANTSTYLRADSTGMKSQPRS